MKKSKLMSLEEIGKLSFVQDTSDLRDEDCGIKIYIEPGYVDNSGTGYISVDTLEEANEEIESVGIGYQEYDREQELDAVIEETVKLQKLFEDTHEEKEKYKKGFNILSAYCDSLPSESLKEINKELEEIGF